ncbi:phage regulatory protein/antirepressor Ant [Phaeobacter gallaeciensis]|nr:phage regulatory protein/antirepressor Ant [Phaeobacter gallaeciensis]MDE4303647.1 phage regulatory protein/antirepressor Ant [Phaeobacter gallaeciensis]MDE4307872.1 phage regulatory protein/antirepressor Ant [Phaeobacter gallaeciensis]MDE4312330.1 phage regulatory protein/antirepressor Ant [Phaeobacter gallaeciensis]MDE4316801.1 phage regulatory protein/antirepressor Ant [Phaeobacter gallaeciensis]MDE4321264.1 phage regulatory protein/antirepressor Ant [Phaeobacter gallaeciensis]
MNVVANPEDFNGLVSESLKTTSRIIAEKFGKAHKDVLRAIRNLECSAEFNERNFAPVEYLDAKGQARTEYSVSRDGFTFLAMGFTGKEAAAWKEKFISAFNAMEQRIKSGGGFQVPQSFGDALRLAADQAEQIEAMKPKVEALCRLEASDGAVVPRVAAKVLGMPERKFFRWLHAHNWAFRQGKSWQGYSEKIKQGYLEHDTHTYTVPETGEERTNIQMKITPKGMARLAQIFSKGGAV